MRFSRVSVDQSSLVLSRELWTSVIAIESQAWNKLYIRSQTMIDCEDKGKNHREGS